LGTFCTQRDLAPYPCKKTTRSTQVKSPITWPWGPNTGTSLTLLKTIRSIFYASSKKKALEFHRKFVEHWESDYPSVVKCLHGSMEACLRYLDFPEEEWISLRTTHVIERLNKEFKRRTKPTEIVPGEESCYRLLAFVSLKMELYWRANPMGKVKENLPFFKQIREM